LAAILAADVVGYSSLTGEDESGTLAALRQWRSELFEPIVADHRGDIAKSMGDGWLVEFDSAGDAVTCAIQVQEMLSGHEILKLRIGLHIGDITHADDDIFGDGVNVAARLEALAEAGGLCVSDVVRQSVEGKLDLAFEDMGPQRVKNIEREVHAWRWLPVQGAAEAAHEGETIEQEIHFCVSSDGVQIAYATVGSGPPLVKAPNWMSHLEYEWKSPVWRHPMRDLAKNHSLLRFDQRGNGLSDREVERFSLEAYVDDLVAVVDAASLERFPLLGISQGRPYESLLSPFGIRARVS